MVLNYEIMVKNENYPDVSMRRRVGSVEEDFFTSSRS